MSLMMDDINHLSREIGARPSGTEEERVAAMYIAENIQKRSGLTFDIEDFEGAKGGDRVFSIISVVSAILFFVSVLLTIITIPTFIISIAVAVIYILEYLEKPVLSKFFRFGISQNIVAKYTPAYSAKKQQVSRKRKLVFITHYDSGKAVSGYGDAFLKFKAISRIVQMVSVCFIPLFLLLKILFFGNSTGFLTLLCVVISVLVILLVLLPTAVDFYETRALYNEAANCNASGNAILMEIARKLGTGAYGSESNEDDSLIEPVVHGKEEAIKSNVVPKDASISYETKQNDSVENNDLPTEESDPLVEKENELASAKAAIAAFTAPRKPRTQYDDEGNIVGEPKSNLKAISASKETDNEDKKIKNVTIADSAVSSSESIEDGSMAIPAYRQDQGSSDVPDWFKSAQNKAKKVDNQTEDNKNLHRSRFAHTVDVMEQKRKEEADKKLKEEEEKRNKLREQIKAANEAAEEQIAKSFGAKDLSGFVSDEKITEKTVNQSQTVVDQAEKQVKEEKKDLTLDEMFKRRQLENTKSVKNVKTETKEQEQQSQIAAPLPNTVNTLNQEQNLIESDNQTVEKQQKPVENKTLSADVTNPVKPILPKIEKSESAVSDKATSENSQIQSIQNIPAISTSEKNNVVSQTNNDVVENSEPVSNSRLMNIPELNLDSMKQYAPLDDESFVSSNEMPANNAIIDISKSEETVSSSVDSSINPENDDFGIEKGRFGTGSFAAVSQSEGVAGATGTFAPVTEQLIENASKDGSVDAEDIVVEDADDSVYNESQFTNSGAFAGEGYMDMPEEGAKGFFGRLGFGKKKNKGKHNLVHDKRAVIDEDNIDETEEDLENNNQDDFEGGAFSSLQKVSFDKIKLRSKKVEEDDIVEDEFAEENNSDENISRFSAKSSNGDAPITSSKRRISTLLNAVPDFEEQIQDFNQASVNIEVWMVALGSEIDENAGIRSFLLEHSQELRGAILVDLEGLGAGELSLVNSEGFLRKTQTASRLKRYVRKAANNSNMAVPSVDIPWGKSSAAYANKQGYKTLRLVGMDGKKPAMLHQKEDVFENIDEDKLKNNLKYLLELIHCI